MPCIKHRSVWVTDAYCVDAGSELIDATIAEGRACDYNSRLAASCSCGVAWTKLCDYRIPGCHRTTTISLAAGLARSTRLVLHSYASLPSRRPLDCGYRPFCWLLCQGFVDGAGDKNVSGFYYPSALCRRQAGSCSRNAEQNHPISHPFRVAYRAPPLRMRLEPCVVTVAAAPSFTAGPMSDSRTRVLSTRYGWRSGPLLFRFVPSCPRPDAETGRASTFTAPLHRPCHGIVTTLSGALCPNVRRQKYGSANAFKRKRSHLVQPDASSGTYAKHLFAFTATKQAVGTITPF
uniref:Uncharacterized protein n=1 Tax=Mycena chlorophos TaxID=658473 RepID=A0ABQ0LGK7_MYCCL|nr:predicted protein [Mycena chlorophos]